MFLGTPLIGDEMVVSPEHPLTFTFADLDLWAHDHARQLILSTLPPTDGEFRQLADTRGVELIMNVQPR
jgi:hypothetical protein